MSDLPESLRQEQNQQVGDVKVDGQGHYLDFSLKQIIQISVDEIKQREFVAASPYKGLKRFEPEDKDDFFGRDQFLKGLVAELEQTNLILLLGASGSGKSSVVRAGLIPYLSREWKSRLVSFTLTPDQNPFESLYASLLSRYKQAEAQIAREARSETLTQVVTTLRQPESRWLLFIDQFEELFTTSQAEQRDRFIDSLVQLNSALKLWEQTKDYPVTIIATMRADFLDRLSPYPALVKATNQHRPMIAEMQQDELRLAIEQPAAHHGVVFETGLVEEIIKDVQGQAGYLPLLQYTLNLLWEQESQRSAFAQERSLRTQTYRNLGGVRGALQKHVDQIYGALTEPERVAAQRIFLKLVEIGGNEESGTEWKPVRRRAVRSEFQDAIEERVLTRLINENLLVSDRQLQAEESTIEIAHEILLTSWETLNTWIKENRQAIVLRNRLNDDVMRWQVKKQEDELWTGSKLEQVLELRKDPTFNQILGGFSSTANQFIDASLGLSDRIRKRQVRQARTIAGVSIGAAVLVGIAGVVAMIQRQEAVRQKEQADLQRQEAVRQKEQADLQRQEAETQKQRAERERMEQYAANAEALLTSEPTEGLVNAIAAVGLSRSLFPNQTTPESVQRSLFTSVQASREEKVIQVPGAKIQQVTFSSDGQSILTVSEEAIVNAWNLQETSSKELFRSSDLSKRVVISSDGQRFLNGSSDGTLQLWNSAGESLGNPFKSPDRSRYAGVSPDGQWIFSYIDDLFCVATFWNSQNFEQPLLEPYKFACGAESTDYHSFSYSGRWFAGGVTYSNSVIAVDLQDDFKKKELTLPVNRITSAMLSSDGKKLVVGDEKGGIYLWDLSIDEIMRSSSEQVSLQEYISRSGHADIVESMAFSPDGQSIVSSSQDGTIRLWDMESLQPISEPMRIQKSVATFVTFSPDGKHIISRSEDGVVNLWDAQRNPTEQGLHDDINNVTKSRSGLTRLTSVAFSNNGQYILVKGNDNWAGLQERNLAFDLQGNSVSEEKQKEITGSVKLDSDSKLNFSPDGERIVNITSDGQNVQMHKVSLESWLEIGCNRLRYHPILVKAETDVSKEAKDTCKKYVWSTNKPSDSQTSEIPATSAETTPSSTVSPPSTSTSAYTFEFPQDSCGDKSALPDAFWYPVFIDDKSVEEVSSQYCRDAQSVSNREKTGKPSVQVASFTDRNKAQAFAERVGGEVGEPHRLNQP